jgi:hypothetical protein
MSEALGMIECRSFPAMVEAADAMVKAAKVERREGSLRCRPYGGSAYRRRRCSARDRTSALWRRCHYPTRSRTRHGEEVMGARRVLP